MEKRFRFIGINTIINIGIKEIIEDYHDTGILPKLTNEQDPFWDPEDINLTKANKQKLENDDDDEMLIVGKNNMQ